MSARAHSSDIEGAGPVVVLRDRIGPEDVGAVREIVASTGFFAEHEVAVAVELVEEHLGRGTASGYFFLFADLPAGRHGGTGRTVGYACYGPIACTVGSYDLYWIAVRAEERNRGLGRRLLREVERRVAREGGRRIYIETSGRDLYAPTRAFYERCGYRVEARLEDFYGPGDAKVIFCRDIQRD